MPTLQRIFAVLGFIAFLPITLPISLLYFGFRAVKKYHDKLTAVAYQNTGRNNGHDSWEGTFWDVASPRQIKASVHIEYRNADGVFSERDIDIRQFGSWTGGSLIMSHCHLRNETRTFRTDRVLSCVDLETGEVIPNLHQWLNARWELTPDRALEKLIDDAWDAMRMMFYISKADGTLNHKERAILRDAVREIAQRTDIDDKRIDSLFRSLDIPSLTAYQQACARLVKQDPQLAIKILNWGHAMIATQKKISPAEQEAVEYLHRKLIAAHAYK